MVAIPKDAATIVLMRDPSGSRSGLEILMLQRHMKSRFLPGAYVFPGGVLEAADYTREAEGICQGLTSLQAHSIIRDASPPEKALGFFVAAAREAFEEAGILLAYDPSGDLVAIAEEQTPRFTEYRAQVQKDPACFPGLIRKEQLALAADRLFYFAHWITPEIAPIRFDTRFFVAVAPPEQKAMHDALETTDSKWISPQQVLERHREGRLNVPFPTYCNVKALAQFSGIEEVIASCRGKEVAAVQPLLDMLNLG